MAQHEFEDLAVAAVFKSYPADMRARLLALRQLVFDTAATVIGPDSLVETLKWGTPSYHTRAKSGTPIRLGPAREAGEYSLFVHCQTSLIDEFREERPAAFRYSGTRALLFGPDDVPKEKHIKDFITAALTYHQRKNRVR